MRITRCPTRSGFPSAWDRVSAEPVLQDEIFGELISRGALRGEVEANRFLDPSPAVLRVERKKGRKTWGWHLEATGTGGEESAVGWHCQALPT